MTFERVVINGIQVISVTLTEGDFLELLRHHSHMHDELENITYTDEIGVLYVPARLMVLGQHVFMTGKHYKTVQKYLKNHCSIYPDISE